MININNLCMFEGRLVKDPKVEIVENTQNGYKKAHITIAVDRVLTAQQKQNENAQKSDFINLIAYGVQADFIDKYFAKGKPIKLVASYRSYTTEDGFGNKKFGNMLVVEQVSFVLSNGNNNEINSNGKNQHDNDPFNDDFNDYDTVDMPF